MPAPRGIPVRRIEVSSYQRLLGFPLLGALLASVLIAWTNLDTNFSGRAYDAVTGTWFGESSFLCRFLYDYGTWPALAIAIGGIGAALLSAILPRRRIDPRAVYLGLVMILGPGLVVNSLFKDNFGRPRPREVIQFGGERNFQAVGVPGTPGEGKSFPSGHASMGFYLAVPALCFATRRRWLFRSWIAIGLVAGGGIGLVRILQGGHFLSDVLWAGVMVFYTAIFTARALGLVELIPDRYRPTILPGYSRLPAPRLMLPAPKEE